MTRCFRHLKSGDENVSNDLIGVHPFPNLFRLKNTTNTTTLMLYTIAIILLALWLLGFISSYTMGGFIHVLLVVAIVVVLVRIIQGRKIL